MESSFDVIPYLAWKWFEFIISFYLTLFSSWVATFFPNNLKAMKDHV